MSGFQPHVPQTAETRSRAPIALIAAAVVVLAALGFLLLGSENATVKLDAPKTPQPSVESRSAARPRTAPYAPANDAGATGEVQTADALGKALTPAPRQPGGYVISAADAPLVAGTPLRAGDVLFEIDGQKLDPERVKRLADELGRYEDVWVSFERDGKRIETLIELK